MISARASAGQAGYAGAAECAACHKSIYESYRATGMARSFHLAPAGAEVKDFFHQSSDTHYSMSVRGGKYYQRRWQAGFDGAETNAEEMPVDYVMGSGSHARTFLSRTSRNTLIELPLAWYSEKGGYWAMNPGYDTPHPPSHRAVAYECMFCHNSYPQIPAGHSSAGSEPVYAGELPEGIDCQRCHGPGAKHIAEARRAGSNGAAIRAAIVNPARLAPDRQMEVCMQCHLQTASTRLPGLIRRFDRSPFSYMPGQPLGDFVLSFDHAPGLGYDDKFDIAGGAYRFRQSECFLRSNGKLTCVTCHDPHKAGHEARPADYAKICRDCHLETVNRLIANGRHPSGDGCVNCHMPRRRTGDAVHVVMTDHRIQRRPPARDLLADLEESHPAPADEYHGEVIPYYPSPLPDRPDTALYVALAQVKDGRNLIDGVPRLERELAKATQPMADFYLALGDAWHEAGNPAKSAAAYRSALKIAPSSERAARFLGTALRESGDTQGAAAALHEAIRMDSSDPQAWFEMALLDSDAGRLEPALANLKKAISLDPDLPDVWNSIGVNRTSAGDAREADRAFRKAIGIDPFYATAHGNLARLLAARGDLPEALYHFDKAAKLQPSDAVNLYEYALALVQVNRFDDSRREAMNAVRASPDLAEAHELLGGLLARNKDMDAALAEFREAVRLKPEFSRAQLDLGATLAARGETSEAAAHLREAARGADPRIAAAAAGILQRLGVPQ